MSFGVGVAVILVAASFLFWPRDNHPEETASHGGEPRAESEQLYRSSDRPAGPDADSDVIEGGIAPGTPNLPDQPNPADQPDRPIEPPSG